VDPLVLTLALDAALQERLDALRRAHFPPERDVVPAHVSLFHALPGEELDRVLDVLRAVTRREPLPVRVAGVRPLGRGTALSVEAPGLDAVHRALAAAFAPWLTAQDRQGLRPHVTVQNKVAPQEARALQEALRAAPVEATGTAVGLDVWHYRGGPWEHAARVPFAPA
jgi:2'-5' RNA ligase